jgi:hypothetical protein
MQGRTVASGAVPGLQISTINAKQEVAGTEQETVLGLTAIQWKGGSLSTVPTMMLSCMQDTACRIRVRIESHLLRRFLLVARIWRRHFQDFSVTAR